MSAQIRVIIFKEDDTNWIAQGLEHDICVQGQTMRDVQERFDVTATLEAEEPGGIARIAAAPEFYFKMWDQRAGKFEPTSPKAHDSIEFGLVA
jgi:hypothetical protein